MTLPPATGEAPAKDMGATEDKSLVEEADAYARGENAAEEDEDAACNQKKFFGEREQVLSLLHELVAAAPDALDSVSAAEGTLDRTSIQAILDRYQEQPHLLDPHLRDLLAPVLSEVKKIITDMYRERCGDRDASAVEDASAARTFPCQIYRNPKLHRLFQVIYQLCKVRGFKTIVKLLPHEVCDFEPTLLMLQSQDRTDHSTWETRYVLLLWLSMLCLVPFDLQTIDSSSTSTSDSHNSIVASILTLCKEYLADSGATQLAAAVCLSRLLSRPDMEAHYLHRFLSWADLELRHAADLLAASSDSAPMSSADWRAQQFKVTGVMRCLAYLAKYSPRELHSAASSIYFASVMRLIAQFTEDDSRVGTASSTLHRKLSVKLVQRLGLLYLPPRVQSWRYQRGLRSLELNLQSLGLSPSSSSNAGGFTSAQSQQSCQAQEGESDAIELEPVLDQLEQIVDALLCGLRDKDTVVRWSAAKGIGRITGRLPFEYADDIVQSVLELFVASEGDGAWHGASLALAELARRGVLLPSRLQDAVDCVARALQYDIRRGTHSIGEHVRDAACYACWSFARAYEPSLLRPHLEQTLAPAMLVTCVFDRELHCRRAASAAFQEHVGRQGRAAFPHGIALLTRADYVSVANRRHAFLDVSPFVASFPEYRDALLEHLVTKKLSHWDASIRELAARAIGRIIVSAPSMHSGSGVCDAVSAQHNRLLRRLLRMALPLSSGSLADPSVEVIARHGATLAIAETTLALLNVPAFIDGELQREVKNLPIEMDKRRLFRGRGGEMIRCAVCRVIRVIALAEMALSIAAVKKLLAFLEECLVHAVPTVRDAAVDAFASFATRYATVMMARGSAPARQLWQDVVPRFLRRGVLTELDNQNPNVAARRGYLRALGVTPRVLFELHKDDGATLRDVVKTMLRAAALPLHTTADEPDAESRVHAIHALVGLFSRVRCDGLDSLRGLEGDLVSTLVRCIHADYGVDERGDVGSWVRKAAMKALECLLLETAPAGRSQELALVGRRVRSAYGDGTIVSVLPASLDACEARDDDDDEGSANEDRDDAVDPVCQVQFDQSAAGFTYFSPRGLARLRLGQLHVVEERTAEHDDSLPFEIPPLAQRLVPVKQQQDPDATVLAPFARRVPVGLIGEIFCALAKQLAEKLDNLRGIAGSILFRLLHAARPRIDGIPDRFQLVNEPQLFPKSLADAPAINWSMAHDTFPRVVRMLDIPEYTEAVLAGLVISVGGLTESVVKASRGALLSWYRLHLNAKNLGLLSRTSFHLVALLTRHQHDDRVTLPLLKTISTLLDDGLLSFLLVTPDNDSNQSAPPPGKEATKSFSERLYIAVRDEIQRATSIPKLVAGITVLVGMLPCDSQEETKVLYALCLFLSHRFPTVRKATAERLYTRLLVHDEIMRGDDVKYEAVVDLLSATAWDGPTSNAKAARNDLLRLLGIAPPASKS
ncbi:hypothetical protein P43SY_003794 [Pythium insidiosum]|uniref:Tubulin-specific chaperone D n=1 Tax=Pythium insidiosum TaxID=114742 RepID=A0AAD5LK24_PYTIN|nr:hypothetical protein P43SY_003794 [Pythium insidiosum]